MKTKLFYNQRTQGGAVEWEAWQPTNIEDENFVYGSGCCLKSVEIEIPDNWKVGKDEIGNTQVYDSNGYIITFKGDIDGNIYALTSESQFPKKVKI